MEYKAKPICIAISLLGEEAKGGIFIWYDGRLLRTPISWLLAVGRESDFRLHHEVIRLTYLIGPRAFQLSDQELTVVRDGI